HPVLLRRPARFTRTASGTSLALLLTACGGAIGALGTTPTAARTSADVMFSALAARFEDVQRPPKFAEARNKLGRWALTPSKLMNDTVVWTHMADSARTLTLSGSLVNARYNITPHAVVRM